MRFTLPLLISCTLGLTSPILAQPSNTVQGTLTTDSPQLEEDNSYYHLHPLLGEAGDTLVLDLISTDFDPYLLLRDPEGETLAQDDDGGEGDNARIVIELPTSGTYTLVANTYQAGDTGKYTLSWRPATPEDLQRVKAGELNQQVVKLTQAGKYMEAIPLAEESLTLRQEILGPDHPEIATSLNNLALLYNYQGRYAEAETLYKQALAMNQRLFGEEHTDVALSLTNLAVLYLNQGRYAEAETLHKQALGMRKRLLGEEHPDVAHSLSSLAVLYSYQGRYADAEPLFRQALGIEKKAFGEEHPDVAKILNHLAVLSFYQGRYGEAEPLFQQALAMRRRLLGEEHPDVASTLNHLAILYKFQGRYAEAERLYLQSLEMRKRFLGEDHPEVAATVYNLAGVYESQGRYAEAETLYLQSLEMNQRLLGENHPDVGNNFHNLGSLYRVQGKYAQAKSFYEKALQLYRRGLGESHPYVATTLYNLAGVSVFQGEEDKALDFLREGVEVQEMNLETLINTGSERQKQDYMKTIASTTDFVVSFHLQNAPNNPQAAKLALTTILRRKGRILDAVADNWQTLRQNLTPENQKLLDDLTEVRSKLAALIFNRPGNLSLEEYQQQVAELKGKANELEGQLGRQSRQFRAKSQPVTIETVQQQIPADGVLVEWVVYRPFDFTAEEGDRMGPPHYAAYLLTASGQVQWVDLGEAEPINQAAKAFKRALTLGKTRPTANNFLTAGRELDQLLMQPIRAKLGNETQILLSPDGSLNLIPFAALVDENQQFLVENYQITYLTTGRDLMDLAVSSPSENPPLILANPDYDQGEGSTVQDVSPSRSLALSNFTVLPLKFTEIEGNAIAALFPNAQLFTENQATETVVKQTPSPQILHLATHGFFLENVEQVASPTLTHDLFSSVGSSSTSQTPTLQENPLLRSGLALAGFNERQSGTEDGVLTALEVASLNLYGTQLVVLSACETGVGEVNNGEGVYGLRRALAIAGSESQVMSLWSVDDEGTQTLMTRYYQKLQQGEGRSEALRQVQLEMLQNGQFQHPFYWSAFIPSGNWRSMSK